MYLSLKAHIVGLRSDTFESDIGNHFF